MKSLMLPSSMFGACEPNLAKLPVTHAVRADAELRSGSMWIIGALFIVAPLVVIWVVTSGILSGKASNEEFWDAALIWGTLILMFGTLMFGTREFYALWKSPSSTRIVTFGQNSIEVAEDGQSHDAHWREDYTSYIGIVLHVTSGELPTHSRQMITLRHRDADRCVLLHKSEGNGLSPAIQDRARLWAKQLNVPVFADTGTGNLVPLDMPH